MPEPLVVRFYLPKDVREELFAGRRVFYSKLISVLESAGFRVEFHSDKLREVIKATRRRGYSAFLMQEPVNRFGVTLRPNYFYPFWNIQTCASRWEWPVAKTAFEPDSVSSQKASTFFNYWRGQKFGPASRATSKDGFVFVPLQGKLLAQRSFQSCTPIEMIEKVLEHDGERQVLATLHPNETYSNREMGALEELEIKHSRFSVCDHPAKTYLKSCDYIVTQNSSVALSGYFFRKNAVLFGQVDFHHIAASVQLLGAKDAIQLAPELEPNYEKYLWWFFRHMSIHVQKPDAETRIKAALSRAGWPIW